MSDELKLAIILSFSKGNAKANRVENIEVDVTGDAFVHEVVEIATSETTITQKTEMGTPGYIFLKNMDSTNYTEVGVTTGVYTVKLKAGEIALYRHDGAAILAKANTAACLLEYCLIED